MGLRVGERVGEGVGFAVAAAHTPPEEHASLLQSSFTAHCFPSAHRAQSGPPQSSSVSLPSCLPFWHPARVGFAVVGLLVGLLVGDGVGDGVGDRVGDFVGPAFGKTRVVVLVAI